MIRFDFRCQVFNRGQLKVRSVTGRETRRKSRVVSCVLEVGCVLIHAWHKGGVDSQV